MTHKFHYASDIHLEFNDLPNTQIPSGTNLILAGDILTIPMLSENRPKSRERSLTFLKNVSKKFKRVFYLSGNHEFYGAGIDEDKSILETVFPNNFVHLYEGSSYNIDEKTVIVGGTLWTDMCGNDPAIKDIVGRGMNDFYYIRKAGVSAASHAKSGGYETTFMPSDAVEIFNRTLTNIKKAVDDNKDKKVVVVTHHAPSILGVSNRYGSTANPINFGYYTALDSFIEERPQIKYWVHGHTHCIHKKKIGSIMLLSNARGYNGEPGYKNFNLRRTFTV